MNDEKIELKLVELAMKHNVNLSTYLDFRSVLGSLGIVKQIDREVILSE